MYSCCDRTQASTNARSQSQPVVHLLLFLSPARGVRNPEVRSGQLLMQIKPSLCKNELKKDSE